MFDVVDASLKAQFVEKTFINDKGETVYYYRVRVTIVDDSSKPYYVDLTLNRDQLMIFQSKLVAESV